MFFKLTEFVCPIQICREKFGTLPVRLTPSVMPQVKALESVLELLFDRSACLLPAYLLLNEVIKVYPDGKNCPHWVRSMTSYLHSTLNEKMNGVIIIFVLLFCVFLRN